MRVVDIDEDGMVLLCGQNGMCVPGRYAAPVTVMPKDVREALRIGQYVDAAVTPHDTPRGLRTYTVHAIRVHA